MEDPVKPEPTLNRSRNFPTRWKDEEFALIEQAAEVKARLEHMEVNPTDIIRAGALMHAKEILAQAA
jgi:hypothetical protein